MIDVSTVVGLIAAFVLIFIGISRDADIALFFNVSALILTIGGTMVATFIALPWSMVPKVFRAFIKLFVEPKAESTAVTIRKMVRYSELAYSQGIEQLMESDEFKMEEPFFRKGLVMLSDGRTEAFIKETLESHIREMAGRHKMIADTFITAGSFAPTFGLLGTVIGIIGVLREISNPAQVGISMSIALLTVFYGILLANVVWIPLSQKLRFRSALEIKYKQLIIQGIICIHQGMIPMMVEQRLKGYLEESKA
jgi:chemotaxis protein MotA